MFVSLNGIQYHVKIIGEGDPVLLLHGFTGSGANWDRISVQFKMKYQLILVDIIGHGHTESPKDYERYSMENACKDLNSLLKYLELDKVNVLGYSMGGRLALSFAMYYPERICSLILESSSPGLKTEGERQARINGDIDLADFIVENGIEVFVNRWELIPLFETQKSLPINILSEQRYKRMQNSITGLANSLLGMGTGIQPSWWKSLRSLDISTLLLAGEHDQKFCKIAEHMNHLLPNSHFEIIKNAGHTIHLEQPDFFGKIVLDYLDERQASLK